MRCLASQLVDFERPVHRSLHSASRDKLGRQLKVGLPTRRGQKWYSRKQLPSRPAASTADQSLPLSAARAPVLGSALPSAWRAPWDTPEQCAQKGNDGEHHWELVQKKGHHLKGCLCVPGGGGTPTQSGPVMGAGLLLGSAQCPSSSCLPSLAPHPHQAQRKLQGGRMPGLAMLLLGRRGLSGILTKLGTRAPGLGQTQ